jgi:hypothetical protein
MTQSPLIPNPPTFADQVYAGSPTFLQGYFGSRYMFCMAVMWDALSDAALLAVRARFPDCAPDDALPYLAQDRQIDRGPNEPRASYNQRLIEWLDLWIHAGGQPSILQALSSYFLPATTTIETVNDTTTDDLTAWDVSVAGVQPPTHYLEDPGNWNWDDQRIPGRSWVIIYNGPWSLTDTWGDGSVWGDADVTPTAEEAGALRAQIAKFKAAGNSVIWIILAFDPSWFVPTLPPGDPLLPDGQWGPWYKVEVVAGARTYVPSRTATALYVSGVD